MLETPVMDRVESPPTHASAQRPDSHSRNSQLDLLRATAILSVLVFHIVQMSPRRMPALMAVVSVGQFGVDLFFVLSGWLIGTLYWKELQKHGDVQVLRFWGRRWMRTIPPYLAALVLAWAAVYFGSARREPFDGGYLLFIQNYYSRIPFFLVSWSLCIEEHFYLLVPLLLALIGNRPRLIPALFLCLIAAAPIGRWMVSWHGLGSGVGFIWTATHLRMEGLLLGFLAAWLPLFKPQAWQQVRRASGWTLGVSALIAGVLWLSPRIWMYRVGLTALAIALVSWLSWMLGRMPNRLATSRIIYGVALSSYSIYLTHALMLHVARKVVEEAHLHWLAYFPIAIALIGTFGALFYVAFEHSAIHLRDKWVARRDTARPSS